jgi:2-desacetyl-2-hydroxyethyl bacteriochlorophyllide A dehydrogenase
MRLGYEWVGEVVAVGKDVYTYNVGDLVHLPSPHRETQTFSVADMAKLGVVGPLPETLHPEKAVFLASTSIALQAVHDAHIKVGDHVVIFGLGVLGLLTVQLAALNGAGRIDAVDPIEGRRKLAAEFGATNVFNPLETDVGLETRNESRGGDVAIEFSGNYSALHDAIRSVRMGGLVVAAGFYQGGASGLRLGEEWLHNRVNMVASTRSWGNIHRDYPLWDRPRLRETATRLLTEGQLRTDQLLTHTFPFERAGEAYQLIDEGSPDVIKVVLNY